MQASVAAVLINLGLNYVLIFGKLGAPVLGVTGAAIATVISRFAECAIVMLHTHRHADRYPFIRGVYASLRIPGVLTGEMLRKSLPLVLNELLWATSQTMVSRCFAERGLQVVAAYNISSAVTGVSSAIFLAFGSAAAILMGNLLGAGALDDARKTAPRIIRFSALVCAAVGLLQIGLSGLFPQLYNTSADIRDLARWFILINGCFQPFFAVSNSAYFTLRAGGSVFITMVFDSAYEWLVATPVAAALAFLTSCPILGIYLAVLLNISDEIIVMYLGVVVERAPSRELFAHPLHPYTRELIRSIPAPDLDPAHRLVNSLRGEVSDPIDPPARCRFAPRCNHCSEACLGKNPKLTDMGGAHFVACALYETNV